MGRLLKPNSIELKVTVGLARGHLAKVANDLDADERYAQASFERAATRESLGDCC